MNIGPITTTTTNNAVDYKAIWKKLKSLQPDQ